MSDFEQELKEGFLEEAAQLLADAEQCFLTLESSPDDPAIIDQLFRLAHNLKGSGNAVGFMDLGTFTHRLESLLLKLKKKELTIDKSRVDLLLKCNDHLRNWIQKLKEDLAATMDSVGLMAEIAEHISGQASEHNEPTPAPEAPIEESEAQAVYPSADAFIEEVHDSAPEMATEIVHAIGTESIAPAPEAEFIASAVREAAASTEFPKEAPKPVAPAQEQKAAAPVKAADESIRVSLNRLEKLINFVGEMVILQSVLKEQSNGSNPAAVRKTLQQLGKVTKEVQDISMSLRMIPLKQIFQKMQRIVRDTSSTLNKKVNLHMNGEETEVDKTVLESLGDPLVHLIRNAVDHGIESAEKRVAAGKPVEGQIFLRAFHQSGNLVIEIRDDGAGLDANRLRAKGVEKGITRPNAVLTDDEAYNLIFAPGFSTKTEVTDVSGRGVGMDVVKTNIAALQGDIHLETVLGSGTCFKITLPLTLAIIDGMIVKSAGDRFVIPLSHVHETIKPAASDVHFVTNIGEVFSLRGENLPLHYLDTLLNKKSKTSLQGQSTAIIVRGPQRAFAVMVDEIVGQAQVVIKQLGLEHKDLTCFSGSAILGDGRPALILELEDLCLRAKPQASQVIPMRRVA